MIQSLILPHDLVEGHWSNEYQLQNVDRAMVAAYASIVPKAKGPRQVSLHIVLNKGQRAPGPDRHCKSLCDAVVHAGALIDDNRQHIELAPVMCSRDPQAWGSVIRLEDV